MATASDTQSRPLIYVVDDEPMILELVAMLLGPLGYRVATFRDPAQALAALAAADPAPALIVTDYAMHTMDGMEFIARCREVVPGQKLVLVSGTVSPEIYAASPVKPDRFLAKPFTAQQLVDLVQELVGR